MCLFITNGNLNANNVLTYIKVDMYMVTKLHIRYIWGEYNIWYTEAHIIEYTSAATHDHPFFFAPD